MGVLFALVPVTLLVVLGYFVLFAANKAEGSARAFGKYLSIWVFVLAGLLLLAVAFAPRFGFRGPGFGHGIFMGRLGPGAHERWRNRDVQVPPPPPSPPAAPSN